MTRAERWWLHQRDPVSFARSLRVDGKPFRPYKQQIDLLRCIKAEICLNWCRQSGKTTVASLLASHEGIFADESLSLVMSVTQKQAGILQRRVTSFVEQYGQKASPWQKSSRHPDVDMLEYDPITKSVHIVRRSVLELELGNGSRIVSVPASSESIRGYSPNLIIMDEASRIPDSVYDAARPMRIITKARLILSSTPNGRRGFFYRVWFAKDKIVWRSSMTADECPGISLEDLEREREQMTSEDIFQQEYYCKFVALEGGLFTAEQLEAIFHPPKREGAPKPIQRGLVPASGEIFVPGMGFR